MKRILRRSFRNRLFAAFLLVSLIPMLACSALLLQIFRLRMSGTAEREAREHLEVALAAMDAASDGFVRVRDALRKSAVLQSALDGSGGGSATRVYNELFNATEGLRGYASFDIYDADGAFRFSTQNLPRSASLPTNWGVLYAASRDDGDAMAFFPCEDAASATEPLLRGAAALYGRGGAIAGYLVVQMYASHFRALFEGKYGAQNDLLVLSSYWRGVYATEPALSAALVPRLRARLSRAGS